MCGDARSVSPKKSGPATRPSTATRDMSSTPHPPIYDGLLSCDRRSGVTWPRRINLIRLMKWPWWSRKLATVQHISLWYGIYLMNNRLVLFLPSTLVFPFSVHVLLNPFYWAAVAFRDFNFIEQNRKEQIFIRQKWVQYVVKNVFNMI